MRWYLLCILNVFVFVNQRCWFNALRSQAHSSPSLSNISDLHQHYHYHTFLSKHIGQMPDAFVSDLFAMKNIVPILPSQNEGNIGNIIGNMSQYCHHRLFRQHLASSLPVVICSVPALLLRRSTQLFASSVAYFLPLLTKDTEQPQ